MNEFDVYENEEAREGYRIDNAHHADWAIGEIAKKKEELDRITEIAQAEINEIQARLELAIARYENGTRFLKGKLYEYFMNLPEEQVKETKTTRSFALLRGTLKVKKAAPTMEPNKSALTDYLIAEGESDFIKQTAEVKWGEYKKRLAIVDGVAVDTVTGEAVPGIVVMPGMDKFEVEI